VLHPLLLDCLKLLLVLDKRCTHICTYYLMHLDIIGHRAGPAAASGCLCDQRHGADVSGA
jgi:hypothetical protein